MKGAILAISTFFVFLIKKKASNRQNPVCPIFYRTVLYAKLYLSSMVVTLEICLSNPEIFHSSLLYVYIMWKELFPVVEPNHSLVRATSLFSLVW